MGQPATVRSGPRTRHSLGDFSRWREAGGVANLCAEMGRGFC
jgi:hypothetical protein